MGLKGLLGIAAVFVLGIGLGGVLGGFLGGDRPSSPEPQGLIEGIAPPPPPLPVTARRSERAIAALTHEEAPPEAEEGASVEEVLAAMRPPPDAPPALDLPGVVGDPVAPLAALDAPSADSSLERPPSPPLPAAWIRHAVTAPTGEGPRIAIVIDDVGIDQARSRRAIGLDGPLTIAFLPYGYHLGALADLARARGHEILVHMPMEPSDPTVDPGPQALMVGLSAADIRERLDWSLARIDGFVGFNNHMGSRFTAWEEGMAVVMDEARARGLLYLDSLTSVGSQGAALARARGVPHAVRDVFLDHDQAPASIAAQLERAEAIARREGTAIAIGHPHDATVAALTAWMPGARARGIVFASVSAIVRERRDIRLGQR